MTERSSDPVNHEIQEPVDESTAARSRTYQVGAWLFLVAVTLCLGATGLVLVTAETSAPVYLPDVLYNAMQLFFLQFTQTTSPLPWQLEIARWLAPVLSGYAIYKGLESVLRDRFQRLRVLLRYHDHVILCGLGRKALRLATAYRQQGRQVVVIEKDSNHPMIDICRQRGMVVLVGDATSPLVMRQAQLAKAERLIALAPDLTNLEIALKAERVLAESGPTPRAIPCFVHVADTVVCRNLRDAEAGRHRSLVVRDYFNTNEIAARALIDWDRCPAFPAQTAGPIHLVIVGLGPAGLALVLEAARRWSVRPSSADRGPLWITAVDREASVRIESLVNRFTWIKGTCTLVPRDLEEQQPEYDACAFLAGGDAPPPNRIYVISEDEAMSLRAALLFWQHRHASGEDYPIILRTLSDLGLARVLPGAERDDQGASIEVFSFLDHARFPDLLIPSLELLARAIHERYLEQKRSQGVAMGSRPAMRPWEELAERYRDSNRQQAASLPRALQLDRRRRYDIVQAHRKGEGAFVFPPDDLERIARNEHERFLDERKRTEPGHPDLVAWDDLTEESKEVVRQQIREWPQVLASVDLTLCLKSS
jgi:TrkA-N domain